MKTVPASEPPSAARPVPPASAHSHPSAPLLAAVLTVIRRDKRVEHAPPRRS